MKDYTGIYKDGDKLYFDTNDAGRLLGKFVPEYKDLKNLVDKLNKHMQEEIRENVFNYAYNRELLNRKFFEIQVGMKFYGEPTLQMRTKDICEMNVGETSENVKTYIDLKPYVYEILENSISQIEYNKSFDELVDDKSKELFEISEKYEYFINKMAHSYGAYKQLKNEIKEINIENAKEVWELEYAKKWEYLVNSMNINTSSFVEYIDRDLETHLEKLSEDLTKIKQLNDIEDIKNTHLNIISNHFKEELIRAKNQNEDIEKYIIDVFLEENEHYFENENYNKKEITDFSKLVKLSNKVGCEYTDLWRRIYGKRNRKTKRLWKIKIKR